MIQIVCLATAKIPAREYQGTVDGSKGNAENIRHRREGKMSKSTAAKNKAIVLEAFETLFNKRDYAAAEDSGHRITFSTVPTLLRDATDSSNSLRVCRKR